MLLLQQRRSSGSEVIEHVMCRTVLELVRRMGGNKGARENISMDQVIFFRHGSIHDLPMDFFAQREDVVRTFGSLYD